MQHYLNKNNSTFYIEAFTLAKNCTDDFWDLDDGISKFLERINSNKNIKTLYSKNAKSLTGWGLWSSLTFCFSNETENEIDDIFNSDIFSEFKEYGFRFEKLEPRKQEIPDGPKHDCLKFINDPNYWNLWHYRIDITEGNGNINSEFWEKITKVLEKIGS